MSFSSWLSENLSSMGEVLKGSKKDPRRSFVTNFSNSNPSMNAWTDSRIDQVRAFRHWTYVAISIIADRISCYRPNIGELIQFPNREISKRNYIYPTWKRAKALSPIEHYQDINPVDYNHPLSRLLSDPNEPDTGYDLWYETVLFLLLTGSAYWWVPKNKVTGLPAAIWVLPSHWMWPIYDKTGVLISYDLRPVEGNYLNKNYPADEIFCFKKKSPISKSDGYSPQTGISQWLDIQSSVDRSRYHTFKNSAFPTVSLEFDPDTFDPSGDELDRIEAKFLARYAGETRAGKPILLPPGVKLNKLSLMPREMDYTQSADQIRDSIMAAFKIPSVIAGIVKEVSSNNLQAANSLFCSNAVNPLFRYLGQVMTEKFSKFYEDNLIIWWDDTTPDDPKNVEDKLKTDLSCLAKTPNEVRAMRGMAPYEHGGDDPIMPNIGLVMPWGTGKDINAVNPFSQPNFQKPKKPKIAESSSGSKKEPEDKSK